MPRSESLKAVDVAVIVSLWTLKFYDTWFQTLVQHTSAVIHGDFVKSESFEEYAAAFLFSRSLLACVLAFFVDAYNHKYAVVMWGMVTYVLTAVLALVMCVTQRITLTWSTMAVSSLLFVTQPAVFGLIFNQKQNPERGQVRRLVSLMEFVEGLIMFIIQEAIPERAHQSQRFPMIATWVIAISSIVFIVTVLDRIRKHLSPDRVKEKGVAAMFNGLCHDIRGKRPESGLSKISVLFFVLLLLPSFSITSLESIVNNLKPENDTQFEHPSVKRIVSFSQLTVIPITEIAISYTPVKEVLAEMAVLGLAHLLNIGVLTSLVIRMVAVNTVDGGQRSADVRGVLKGHEETHALPNTSEPSALESISRPSFDDYRASPKSRRISRQIQGKFIGFIIVNPTFLNVTVKDEPPQSVLDAPTKHLPPQFGYFGRSLQLNNANISVKIHFEHSKSSIYQSDFTFKAGTVAFLRMTDDPQFAVGLTQDGNLPKYVPKPILLVHNTFVGAKYWGKILGPGEHEFRIETATGRTIVIDTFSDRRLGNEATVSEGKLKLIARYQGADPVIMQNLGGPVEQEIEVKPGSVNVIVVSIVWSKTQPGGYYKFFDLLEVYKSIPPDENLTTTTAAPLEPEKPDAALQTALTMAGAMLGLTSVGYIHFFWMESPFRLRSTLYACFLVLNQIIGWTAAQIIGKEIRLGEAISLLVVAIFTAIWHFVLGWYYDNRINPNTRSRQNTRSQASQ